MNTLNYLLQTNLYLILFMGFYMLVLRNETFFKQNRIYLNGSVLLSFVIPFINSDWFRELFITRKVREATMPLQVIYDPVVVQVSKEAPKWTVADVMMWIYLTGAFFFLIRFIIQLIGLKYNLTTKRGSAFSFFKMLIIDAELPGRETIVNHEKVHIRQWHSLDVLFIELAAVLNWFNPLVYLYKKEIKHIHEFIADEEAAATGGNKSEYALLLLSNSLGVAPHQLTNSFFNQSLLKRRIFMLSKKRSHRAGLFKYGLAAPLFTAMLIVSAASDGPYEPVITTVSQKISNSLTTALSTQEEPDNYKAFLKRNPDVKELAWKINPYRVIVYLKNGQTETYNMDNGQEKEKAQNRYGKLPYPPPPPPAPPAAKQPPMPLPVAPDTPPPPPAKPDREVVSQPDIKLLSRFLGKNIAYPAMARDNKITGLVVASFKTMNQVINDVKIVKGAGYGLDEEVARAFSMYKEPVDLKDGEYTIGVIFRLVGLPNTYPKLDLTEFPNHLGNSVMIIGYQKDQTFSTQDGIKDFASVEVLPEFPGGEKGFGAFLSQNLKYPASARTNKITGRVFVSFVVEKDGGLSDIKILRGLGYGTDEEAVRVLKLSPKWKPGIQYGKPVRVQYTIPISFQLTKKDDSKSQIRNIPSGALYIADGRKISEKRIRKLDPASIKSLNVLKGESAVQKYGTEGENGVIEIYIKNAIPRTF